jgi:acylphosphatase
MDPLDNRFLFLKTFPIPMAQFDTSISTPNQVRAHVLIEGRVQGVFYRASTQQAAQAWGILGWVRNLPDGRVEAVFQGNQTNIEKMVTWCHQGPANAEVTHVTVDWQAPQSEEAFRICD